MSSSIDDDDDDDSRLRSYQTSSNEEPLHSTTSEDSEYRLTRSSNDDAFSSTSEEENNWNGDENRLYQSSSVDDSEFISVAEQQVLREASNAHETISEEEDDASLSIQSSRSSFKQNIATTTTKSPVRRKEEDLYAQGILPDLLMDMRQKIESMTLFDSDMMRLAAADQFEDDPMSRETRETLKRSSQQSVSASVLVSLAHKRYERRRLAAMEIEKTVRGLSNQEEFDRIRAILLLLSDDYVRSTNEDARKGGVVALAACAIGLKKADTSVSIVQECQDLILASVVHACQDHSQRVRYYATESLFNVVKVVPALAVQHFFILFEILRSLYADVNVDVRTGAEMLDRKLKEVVVLAMNEGGLTAEACVPVFARFVHIHNKATNRLTLTWLQELNEKVSGSPILEFLHLFLGGIFHMIADPTVMIRQSALAFLQSVLPKLLVQNEEQSTTVDYDKILQSLVTSMEHPDPFVRKVAVYWMSRIIKVHIGEFDTETTDPVGAKQIPRTNDEKKETGTFPPATTSVRNSLPHVLPGILLSIGDEDKGTTNVKNGFLPDQMTCDLAEQTNECLQEAVRKDGQAYVHHLDGFIVALREELDSPGGSNGKHQVASERSPFRGDVKSDGTGIERPGWFRASSEVKQYSESSMVKSRLCALEWIIVLYENVVPHLLKADYAREFVFAIINQLLDGPPKAIISKSIEVLAKITIPDKAEDVSRSRNSVGLTALPFNQPARSDTNKISTTIPESNIIYALETIESERRGLVSRNREVFSAIIRLHAHNEDLLADLSTFIAYMCKLQPPEFIFISFAVEIDRYILECQGTSEKGVEGKPDELNSRDLQFVSTFVQHLCHVLLNADEAKVMRDVLHDCIGSRTSSEHDRKRARVFQILLHAFAHNVPAAISLCYLAGAYKTISLSLSNLDPLDIDLIFLLEIDRVVEILERPLFRHLPIRMLQADQEPDREGSGIMLFTSLKKLIMILPQSACYQILKDRVTSLSRYRMSALPTSMPPPTRKSKIIPSDTEAFVKRILDVRSMHTLARWESIREASLEVQHEKEEASANEGEDRRDWLGYESKEQEEEGRQKYRNERDDMGRDGPQIEVIEDGYHNLEDQEAEEVKELAMNEGPEVIETPVVPSTKSPTWKNYWVAKEEPSKAT